MLRSQSVNLEGALFGRDFLMRLAAPISDLPHLAPDSYGQPNVRLREAIGASFNLLAGRWARFQSLLRDVSSEDAALGLTRREWLLPLFEELKFGRLQTAAPIIVEREGVDGIERKSYPISHAWNHVPMHLVGWNTSLDRRGASTSSAPPHALLQEALNRSPGHLWGIVSNGRKVRLLRDSAAIARQSFIEWDLESIFAHSDTSAFALMWLMLHASRFEVRRHTVAVPVEIEAGEDAEAEAPAAIEEEVSELFIEDWQRLSTVEGQRALDNLYKGVKAAIETISAGFLAHAANDPLRTKLKSKELDKLDFYKLNLRLVYRLLFVLVAEARDGLLLNPTIDQREIYRKYFSLGRWKSLAAKQRGGAHGDGYEALKVLWQRLREGSPGLALPALGSVLFEPIELDECSLSNANLFEALRALCFVRDERGVRRPVNFQLDSQELGSVYESLLEMSPDVDVDARTFTLLTLAGNERKTTGSYYTPQGLVKSLLDSALDPVLEEAARSGESGILSLRICDPACGSGAFLSAAARRVARRLALLRTGGDEPSPKQSQAAMRDVVSRCIFGVDLNPMAVELCQVALWMESLEPGRPLSFLDSHIRCGNALLGATPELLEAPLPPAAYEVLEGDDRAASGVMKADARAFARGNRSLLEAADEEESRARQVLEAFEEQSDALENLSDNDLRSREAKQAEFARLEQSPEAREARRIRDAWCAAWVWPKPRADEPDSIPALSPQRLQTLAEDPAGVPLQVLEEVERLRQQYRWFHWHLEFPQVFGGARDQVPERHSGFDVVLGNPPWERLKLQEKEWFARRVPEIARAANANARKALIARLPLERPEVARDFAKARRRAEGESHFARKSGRFPLCGTGDVNTYALFAELNRSLINPRGRVGCVVPSGIATDDTTKAFFADITAKSALVSLFDFENRRKIFPAVDSRMKFCLLTTTGARGEAEAAQFVFFAHEFEDAEDAARRFELSGADIALLNPNTRTCPIFRSSRDAELTKSIYRRVPILLDENRADGNPWSAYYIRLVDFSDHKSFLKFSWEEKDEDWNVPLYEAKMFVAYDHRFATYGGVSDEEVVRGNARRVEDLEKTADFIAEPRYFVPQSLTRSLRLKYLQWSRDWWLAWRDICRSTDERTCIATIIPNVASTRNSMSTLGIDSSLPGECLLANLNSFVLDFLVRQKLGGVHLSFGVIKQLPVLLPSTYASSCAWESASTLGEWISSCVLELTYTAYDLEPFARDLKYLGEPFGWDARRRLEVRAELDAAFFHLYGLARDEVEYVLGTFTGVAKKERDRWGEFLSRRLILEHFERMSG